MEKQIVFRASSFANLLVKNKDTSITDVQLDRIDELVYEMENGLNKNGNKVKWTDNKADELQKLIEKRDAKPELSLTAKKEVQKIWLQNEKGFIKNLDNKYVMKGLFNEENGIELIGEIEEQFFLKNEERITIGSITGEADIIHTYNSVDELPEWRKLMEDGETKFPLKVVKDVKCSFDAETFMNAEFSSMYETQLRVYMMLYNADEAHLQYCLTDAPDHILEAENWKLKNKYGIIDMDSEIAKPLFDQVKRNLIYSDNPEYSKEERLKSYMARRDKTIEQEILDVIPMALEYYKTITLNKTQ